MKKFRIKFNERLFINDAKFSESEYEIISDTLDPYFDTTDMWEKLVDNAENRETYQLATNGGNRMDMAVGLEATCFIRSIWWERFDTDEVEVDLGIEE